MPRNCLMGFPTRGVTGVYGGWAGWQNVLGDLRLILQFRPVVHALLDGVANPW